ncbi:MAG: type II 3-dehydroquinate dehydratase [Pseudomonadota bacterium]
MATTQTHILILNGPNLNLLGTREPAHYGRDTLDDIVGKVRDMASALNVDITAFQSNSESDLIDRVHASSSDGTDGLIVNPAAFTHTSIALRDALAAVGKPFVEVHLSNVYAREPFRHHSYFSDLAIGVISGLGSYGYLAALQALSRQLEGFA